MVVWGIIDTARTLGPITLNPHKKRQVKVRRKKKLLTYDKLCQKEELIRAMPAVTSVSVMSEATQTQQLDYKHAFILVHGLFGSPSNWTLIKRELEEHLNLEDTTFLVSKDNQYSKTYEGVQKCGDRLVEEILSFRQQTPNLKKISFISHSMGGLISRYAIGKLYNAEDKTVAGLQPVHYVSMATPHLGCHRRGPCPAQVPLLTWTQNVPLIGSLLGSLAVPVSSQMFKMAGREFFLEDDEHEPIIAKLASGEYIEGLKAFRTRTAYANKSGDHLVSWANASIRRLEELPKLEGVRGLGVVLEDALEAGWHADKRPRLSKNPDLEVHQAHVTTVEGLLCSKTPEELEIRKETVNLIVSSGVDGSTLSVQGKKEAQVEKMLSALQKLPWRRIDACFAKSRLPMLAHQHLQVKWRWANGCGLATAKHLALSLQTMEDMHKWEAAQ